MGCAPRAVIESRVVAGVETWAPDAGMDADVNIESATSTTITMNCRAHTIASEDSKPRKKIARLKMKDPG